MLRLAYGLAELLLVRAGSTTDDAAAERFDVPAEVDAMMACEVTTSRYSFTGCPSIAMPVVRIIVASLQSELARESPSGAEPEARAAAEEAVGVDAAGKPNE